MEVPKLIREGFMERTCLWCCKKSTGNEIENSIISPVGMGETGICGKCVIVAINFIAKTERERRKTEKPEFKLVKPKVA